MSVSVDMGPQCDQPQRWGRGSADRIVTIQPGASYVYVLADGPGDGQVLYVGRSDRIWVRLAEHLRNPTKRDRIGWIRLLRCDSHEHAVATELNMIREFQPPMNRLGVKRHSGKEDDNGGEGK